MSIKKELLSKLTEKQLKDFAENKGIKFNLSDVQKKYYEGWSERDKLIDVVSDNSEVTIKEIEEFIKKINSQ